MRVLMLGGTGAMGAHLSRLLAEAGNEVVVSSRRKRKKHGRVSYVQGNAKDDVFLVTLLAEEWDVIVDFMVYTTEQFSARVEKLLGATSQYIYLSSARVYAESDRPLKEDSPRLLDVSEDDVFLSTDEYALSKAREENILKNADSKNWTVIRPYITYAENRLQLGVLEKEEWLYRALKGRTVIFSEDIASKLTTVTYGYDVATGIAAIVGCNDVCGRSFHITGSNAISWKELLDVYLEQIEKHLGKQPKLILADLDTFMRSRPYGRYQICYDRLYDRRFDNSAISKHVDVSKFLEPKVGLAKCINSFLECPAFDAINWRGEAFKDRICKEHTPLSEIDGLKNKIKYILYRYFKKVN